MWYQNCGKEGVDVRSPVWVAPRVTFLRKATWSCIDCCILTVSTTHARNKNVNSTCYHPKRDALKLLITIVVLLVGNLNQVNSLMIMEIIWISEKHTNDNWLRHNIFWSIKHFIIWLVRNVFFNYDKLGYECLRFWINNE